MRVHLFSLCWNEEKILPYFFKHYKERFKDIRFTIYDNMSTDASRKIMLDNGAEIIDNDTGGEIRMDRQMEIKNTCYKQTDADWIIVCDIDEWLDCDDHFIENTACTVVKATGYNMVGFTYNLDKVVNGYYSYRFDKCVLFKNSAITAINYNPGCHHCFPEGDVVYNTEKVALYHMKYFHPLYFIKRSLLSAKRVSQYNRERKFSRHYSTNIFLTLRQYASARKRSQKVRMA